MNTVSASSALPTALRRVRGQGHGLGVWLAFGLVLAFLVVFLLIPIGLAFAVVYYFLFRFLIVKLDLKTPGREDDEVVEGEGKVLSKDTNFKALAAEILEGLGGKENIASLDYCITRLRLEVKDNLLVNEAKIKKAGVAGVVRPSKTNVQVVIGPQVQFVADEFKKLI